MSWKQPKKNTVTNMPTQTNENEDASRDKGHLLYQYGDFLEIYSQ